MLKDPHQFLEGMMIGCYAINCKHGYIYVRGEYFPSIKSLNEAIDELYAARRIKFIDGFIQTFD